MPIDRRGSRFCIVCWAGTQRAINVLAPILEFKNPKKVSKFFKFWTDLSLSASNLIISLGSSVTQLSALNSTKSFALWSRIHLSVSKKFEHQMQSLHVSMLFSEIFFSCVFLLHFVVWSRFYSRLKKQNTNIQRAQDSAQKVKTMRHELQNMPETQNKAWCQRNSAKILVFFITECKTVSTCLIWPNSSFFIPELFITTIDQSARWTDCVVLVDLLSAVSKSRLISKKHVGTMRPTLSAMQFVQMNAAKKLQENCSPLAIRTAEFLENYRV